MANESKKQFQERMVAWAKRSLSAFILIGCLAIVTKMIGGASFLVDSHQDKKWELAATAKCPIQWNEELAGPWCNAGSFKPGVYRIVPRYDSWHMAQLRVINGQEVLSFLSVPPQGVWLSQWDGSSFKNEFLQQAPHGGNQKVGALVAKIGPTGVADAFDRIEIKEAPMRILIGPNLPPTKEYFQKNTGEIIVDIERMAD